MPDETLIQAARTLLHRIEDMTTEDFAHGREAPEREALRSALEGRTVLTPTSPCEAIVSPDDKGGISVDVFVPTYEGGARFNITTERSNDGDWVVSIPWLESNNDRPVILADGHECLNGLIYLGAPDVDVTRSDAA